jgi:hypothetical protein
MVWQIVIVKVCATILWLTATLPSSPAASTATTTAVAAAAATAVAPPVGVQHRLTSNSGGGGGGGCGSSSSSSISLGSSDSSGRRARRLIVRRATTSQATTAPAASPQNNGDDSIPRPLDVDSPSRGSGSNNPRNETPEARRRRWEESMRNVVSNVVRAAVAFSGGAAVQWSIDRITGYGTAARGWADSQIARLPEFMSLYASDFRCFERCVMEWVSIREALSSFSPNLFLHSSPHYHLFPLYCAS